MLILISPFLAPIVTASSVVILPRSNSSLNASSTLVWSARLIGRAPYSGSNPAEAPTSIAAGVILTQQHAVELNDSLA